MCLDKRRLRMNQHELIKKFDDAVDNLRAAERALAGMREEVINAGQDLLETDFISKGCREYVNKVVQDLMEK